MKLYVSPTSPYGRICLARALLLGRNDLSLQMVDPWQNPPELEAINPLSQIPVLVLDDEKTAVPGTLPICLYLGGAMPPAAELSAISQTHALLEMLIQIVKLVRFKAPDTADHPLVARSVTALKRALAQVPAFDGNSQAWPDVMLAVVLLSVKLRRPEEFAGEEDSPRGPGSNQGHDSRRALTPAGRCHAPHCNTVGADAPSVRPRLLPVR